MVDSVAATLDAIVASGGQIVQPIGADAPEITARFRDPAGNVIGLYQTAGAVCTLLVRSAHHPAGGTVGWSSVSRTLRTSTPGVKGF